MKLSDLPAELLNYVKETVGELRALNPANLRKIFQFRIEGHAAAFYTALALFISFQQLYFWHGKHDLSEGAFYRFDVIYGWDTPRVIDDMVDPGHNARGNVHPLFTVVAKPLAAVFSRGFRLSKGTTAVAVVSILAAASVVFMMLCSRIWGAALPESAMFAAIFGASTIVSFGGSIPETGIFSLLGILLALVLSIRSLVYGVRREIGWVLGGIYTYGINVYNIAKYVVGFGFSLLSHRPLSGVAARTAAYAIFVTGSALFLTWAVGSPFNMKDDKWVVTPEIRGGSLEEIGSHLVRNFFLYDVVGPTPSVAYVKFFDKTSGNAVTFNQSSYQFFPRLLAIGWGVILASSLTVALIGRRPHESKLIVLLLTWIAMDFAFFSRYYVPFEGVFQYSVYVIVPVFGFTLFLARRISGFKPSIRIAALVALALFLIGELANNFWVHLETIRLWRTPL